MATVRTARADDLSALLALYGSLNPEDPVLDPESVADQWADMLADDSLDVLVLEHDDHLVATCVLAVVPNLTRGARPFAVIENVVTHEDYRGQGFGKRVVRAALDRAEARDCYKVMLLAGTDREWKLDFYEDCGFDREDKTGFVKYL